MLSERARHAWGAYVHARGGGNSGFQVDSCGGSEV